MRLLSTALIALLLSVPAAAEVRIALLPLAVHAAGDDSDYLQNGLSEMLASRLDQYEAVSVVRVGGEAPRPDDTPSAQTAARDAGADLAVFGSFTRFGDGASLDLRCVRADADSTDPRARRIFIQSGTLAEIIPQLDTLAQKVARYAIGAGGAAPRLAGSAPAAAAVSAEEHADLVRRLEAIERALFPPVASGDTDPAPATPADEEAEEVLVR